MAVLPTNHTAPGFDNIFSTVSKDLELGDNTIVLSSGPLLYTPATIVAFRVALSSDKQ